MSANGFLPITPESLAAKTRKEKKKMKVYSQRDENGKTPLEERSALKHADTITALLEAHGFYERWHPYGDDMTIVLSILSEEECQQEREERRQGIRPSLYQRRWKAIVDMLTSAGYECEDQTRPEEEERKLTLLFDCNESVQKYRTLCFYGFFRGFAHLRPRFHGLADNWRGRNS
jgi:hypothetical protein